MAQKSTMGMIDKYEVMDLIEETIKKALCSVEEKWLSEEECLAHFQMFSANYLKYHKTELGARKVEGGKGWGYPMHFINAQIRAGKI